MIHEINEIGSWLRWRSTILWNGVISIKYLHKRLGEILFCKYVKKLMQGGRCGRGVFLKNQCSDQIFAYFSFILSQKRQFFRWIFRRKYLNNHNIGPWLAWRKKMAPWWYIERRYIEQTFAERRYIENWYIEQRYIKQRYTKNILVRLG
jgi:hypothetical protein